MCSFGRESRCWWVLGSAGPEECPLEQIGRTGCSWLTGWVGKPLRSTVHILTASGWQVMGLGPCSHSAHTVNHALEKKSLLKGKPSTMPGLEFSSPVTQPLPGVPVSIILWLKYRMVMEGIEKEIILPLTVRSGGNVQMARFVLELDRLRFEHSLVNLCD